MRGALHTVFSALPHDELAQQRERGALVFSVPELRAAMLDQVSKAVQVFAELVAERVGRRPDDLAVLAFVGATMGAIMAAVLPAMNDPGADFLALMDAGLAQIEAGLPL
jgi:hypothetical protein